MPSWALTLLACCVVVSCSRSSKQQKREIEPLRAEAARTTPPPPIAIPDEPLREALELAVAREWGLGVVGLSHVRLEREARGQFRVFFLYAYSKFSPMESDDADDCAEQAAEGSAEAYALVAELEEKAAKSNDPDIEQALLEARTDVQALRDEEHDCYSADSGSENADWLSQCESDATGLAIFDVTRGARPGDIELKEVENRETEAICGPGKGVFAGSLHAADLDQDGEKEVLMAVEQVQPDLLRGMFMGVDHTLFVRVYRFDGTVQEEWPVYLPKRESDDAEDQSGRVYTWFEDVNGDGRDDFVVRHVSYRPGCSCAAPTFKEGKDVGEWRAEKKTGWHAMYQYCEEESDGDCALAGDKREETHYEPARDEW